MSERTLSQRPAAAAFTMATCSAGNTLAPPLIQLRTPQNRKSAAVSSAPQMIWKSGMRAWMRASARLKLPLLSLMPMMLGTFASACTVSSAICTPTRCGKSYRMMGSGVAWASLRKCSKMPAWLARLYGGVVHSNPS
ncbi:hypothetical protein CDEF62S_06360 [Castellaniella defragrans]